MGTTSLYNVHSIVSGFVMVGSVLWNYYAMDRESLCCHCLQLSNGTQICVLGLNTAWLCVTPLHQWAHALRVFAMVISTYMA